MKAVLPNFLSGDGFQLADSFCRFSGKLPGGLWELFVSLFAGHRGMAKLGGKTCVLDCPYLFILFIHSFIYDLYIYFLLFINLLLGSCLSGHSSILLGGTGGGRGAIL